MLSGTSSTSLRDITTITFVVLVIDATLVATIASCLGVGSCWDACMILVIAIFLHVIWEIDDTYLVVIVASSLDEGMEIYPYGYFLLFLLDDLCIEVFPLFSLPILVN